MDKIRLINLYWIFNIVLFSTWVGIAGIIIALICGALLIYFYINKSAKFKLLYFVLMLINKMPLDI